MSNTARKEEPNHAEQNAAGWYGSIAELVAALEVDYDRLEELTDERTDLQAAFDEADTERQEAVRAGDPDEAGRLTTACGDAQQAITDWDEENAEELRELTEAATVDGELQKDADAVRERIQEGPLGVDVRSGWHTIGGDNSPEEARILLTTGGPALQLMVELDENQEPTRAYLQYQDWGTPWTDYYAGEGSGEILLTYCQQFYFGE